MIGMQMFYIALHETVNITLRQSNNNVQTM